MLKLKNEKPFATGGHCLVFTHTETPAFVIKIINPDFKIKSQKRLSFRNLLFRRHKEYNDFFRYASGLVAALAKTGTRPSFLQNSCQFVETDLGPALVTKAERDETGAYAPTLRTLLSKGKFDEKARKALEEFFSEFLESDVIASDLSANNIVYSHDPERGTSRFIVIDGLGEKNAIPICSWFRFFNKRAQKRYVQRIRVEINRLHSRPIDTETVS